MIFQNLKTFGKHLLKNKLYTVVTVFGFAVSLMFVVLISAYIKQETSVDKFHENKDRLFRMVNEGNSTFGATIGEKIKTTVPEVESYIRVYYYEDFFTPEGNLDKKLNTEFLATDSSFFNMFTFNLLEGRTNEVLRAKNSVVLTQQYARTLFGEVSPVGKQIKSSNGIILQVTGVVEDFPKNTQFKECNAIINIQSLGGIWGYNEVLDNDNMSGFTYYFLAKTNSNLPTKNTQILELLKKDFWMYQQERAKTLDFEPITESYFSDKKGNIRQNSKTLIAVLSVIVLVIITLATINYINLTVAQSGFRNKEIAIRKLIGSSRSTLVKKLIFESVLLCFIATGIGVFMAVAAEPVFNNVLDTNIRLLKDSLLPDILIIVSVTLIIGVISGIFPALFLTKLQPVDVVKGSFQKKNKTSYSKILVSFQFTATIALIICAIFIIKQNRFLRRFDLGFEKNNIVQIDKPLSDVERQAFGHELKQIPGVEQVSFVCGSPIDGGNNQSFIFNNNPVSLQEFIVDTSFFSMMGITYKPTGVAWSENILWLNETTVKQLELDSLPKSFKRYSEELPVYGIVDDYHFQDLHQSIGPSMLRPLSNEQWSWSILIKISGNNITETMDRIKSAFNTFTGGEPFDYEFMDSAVDNWYRKEENTAKIITYFSLLTIIISVMGILALITFYNQLRIKEIGIRKVNGAKVSEILAMLNKDFVRWVAIAFVIATPVAYYAMNRWLQNFAYKTNLSWWIFALAGSLALGISLLIVSLQSWRAATRNPVEALRYE